MFKYILKIFKFVSTDLLYIEVIYFFVVHALRTSSARFAKTQLLELYIKNMPIKLWYNLKMRSFWFFVPIPQALPTVAKELGVWGLVPTNNTNLKLFFDKI